MPKAYGAEDGTALRRYDIARGKAYGALAMGVGSKTLGVRAVERPHFISAVNGAIDGAMVPVAGGVLIKVDGEIVGCVGVTGDDVAVLNVVRMGDEPKRLSEIGQLLNRVDVPNLQYATRKLVRSGLIETEGSSSRKETRYRATATGRSVTEAYAALRAATLPPMLEALDGWAAKSETTSIQLDLISSLYAQAAQVAITRRHQP